MDMGREADGLYEGPTRKCLIPDPAKASGPPPQRSRWGPAACELPDLPYHEGGILPGVVGSSWSSVLGGA